ncbi:helix-turn-helix domain-containing protein [uncultured Streptomyces sp.]|uniref:helix-turn-helix domain-containing protein n=1 Tax=uncultured Streptomyces sp. TaxID=174707 RepID=UPI00260D12E6|nr:AraC family transcriptional regulator [uncultured Streptomyces sp.]
MVNESPPGAQVRLPLERPPRVAGSGTAVHGTDTRSEVFRLPDLWQLHLYRYSAELVVDGVPHMIRPGHVSLVQPGSVVEFRYTGRSEHLFVHFAAGAQDGPGLPLPVAQPAGPEAGALTDTLRRAVAAAPHSPARASVEVWSALWRVCDIAARAGSATGAHTPVGRALAHIESRLPRPLTVPEVAAAAGVSHNHLIRLFRAETGDTVVAHIRRRRMERARHLLRESTLSIPAVAASVGVPDLQAFNKLCRRELGASPRAVRAGQV